MDHIPTFLLTLSSYLLTSLISTIYGYSALLTSFLTSISLYRSNLPASPSPPASEHLIRLPYHILTSQSYTSAFSLKFCASATITSDQLGGNPFAVFPSSESCVAVPWSVALIGFVGVWWVLPLQFRIAKCAVKRVWRAAWMSANVLVMGVMRGGAVVAGIGRGDRRPLE